MADKNTVELKRSDYHMAYAFAFAILYFATDRDWKPLLFIAGIHTGIAACSAVKETVANFKKRRAVAKLIKG